MRAARRMSLAGAAYAVAAYTTWGVLPVYWKALAAIPAVEVIAHRVLWTVVVGAVLLSLLGRWDELRGAWRDRRERRALLASGTIIGGNWLIYVWAVNHDQLLEASFGYYLNPLLSVLLGVAFLGERLRRPQLAAVALAGLGVAALGIRFGGLPWISLSLAASFGLYGLLHKLGSVRPIPGLTLEIAFIAPVAAAALAAFEARGTGAVGSATLAEQALLVGSGFATALPLLLFASAARRLALSTLGLFQYIAPTIGFLLAVLVYGEPFSPTHAFAFACIWLALAVYTGDAMRGRSFSSSLTSRGK